MSKWALITGASSGIGLELSKKFGEEGHSLILVARSENKLVELKELLIKNYPIKVEIIIKDLSREGSGKELYEEIKKTGINIEYLINNAGFGEFGEFINTPWEKERNMINLNIMTLTELTKFFVKDMARKGSGKILNVASTAAFQPGPLMAVYYATKSYVLHFSEAINYELKGSGVTVTALCPGATTSGFMDAASLGESKLFNKRKLPTSREVAEYGYRAMMRGESVAIHGVINRILSYSIRFLPRDLVVKVVKKIQENK